MHMHVSCIGFLVATTDNYDQIKAWIIPYLSSVWRYFRCVRFIHRPIIYSDYIHGVINDRDMTRTHVIKSAATANSCTVTDEEG